MKGVHEFIIEIKQAFDNTIEYGSLKLHTDHRTKQQEQSNRKGVVISLPMSQSTHIKQGAEVIIDPTVLFKQVYNGEMEDSRFLVDKEKGWYRVLPDMVLLYKNPRDKEFSGSKQNLFIKPIKDEVTKIGSIFIPKPENEQESLGEVVHGNKEISEVEGINKGAVIFYKKDRKWEFDIEGEKLVFIRNVDVLGVKQRQNE